MQETIQQSWIYERNDIGDFMEKMFKINIGINKSQHRCIAAVKPASSTALRTTKSVDSASRGPPEVVNLSL